MPLAALVQSACSSSAWIVQTGRVLDNSNAAEMYEVITSARRNGFTHVIVDMQHLEFISSAGVGCILANVEDLRDAGGDIILCGLSDPIRHVLEVLDLADFLTLVPTRDAALVAVGAAQ